MSQTHQLHRHLRLFDATTIVVGSMIGSGIFVGLSIMAQWVETPGLLIGLWIYVIQRDPQATLIGLLLALTGVPFYVTWKARRVLRGAS